LQSQSYLAAIDIREEIWKIPICCILNVAINQESKKAEKY
jgi:hypothetical protein